MEYSFDVCYFSGKVFLSDDKKGCALVMLPDKKKANFRSVWLDLKLIVTCIGLSNIKKALTRETRIKRLNRKNRCITSGSLGLTWRGRVGEQELSCSMRSSVKVKLKKELSAWKPPY